MPDWGGQGKTLILVGAVLALVGVLLVLGGKLPGLSGFGWLGKLPGDIYIKRDRFTFYAPLATSVVISIVISLVFFLLSSFWRR